MIKVKLLTDAVGNVGIVPAKGTPMSACYDLYLPKKVILTEHCYDVVDLLVAFELPEWHYLRIYGRSSTFVRAGIVVPTSIVDWDYRDSVHAFLYNTTNDVIELEAGSRVVQAELCKIEHSSMVVTDHIMPMGRGKFGSTGT